MYLTIRDSNEQIVRVFALLQILTAIYFIMSNKMAIALIVLVLIQMKLSHNPFIVSQALDKKRRWRQVITDFYVIAALLSLLPSVRQEIVKV